jgi:hypothetical protein
MNLNSIVRRGKFDKWWHAERIGGDMYPQRLIPLLPWTE